jgi:hypothetical protein
MSGYQGLIKPGIDWLGAVNEDKPMRLAVRLKSDREKHDFAM